MNKLTKGLLSITFATAMVGAVACGGNASDAWKKPSFSNYGAVEAETLGGFVAETTNYVYFINGVGKNTSDNSFGTPIKGALVAAPKNDLSKTEVVVPELLVARDYNAGVYLFGSGNDIYAYYGTPNREKDSSGAIANSEMTFSRTRIDGEKNEKLFTVSSLSTEYRMTEVNGTVYIVYYDSSDSAIKSFNCTDKKTTVVAKTDAKINDKNADGEYVSLDAYKFLDNGAEAEIVYTLTVYSEQYYEEKEKDSNSYSREKETYNYIMSYKAGESAKVVKSGKAGGETYAFSEYADGYLFYKETPVVGDEKTFAVSDKALADATEIVYTDNVKSGMIIKNLDEVYFYDSGKVVKTVLTDRTGTEYEKKENILISDDISTIIDIDDDYVYTTNGDGYIIAIERAADGKTVKISERTASSSWYDPETIEISGEKYILYCDESGVGNSYVYYADLSKLAAPQEKDSDDDGEIDEYYLESKFIGVMPTADRATSAGSLVSDIESSYKEEDNGAAFRKSVEKARAAYDALDADAKAAYDSSLLAKLTNTEKAVKLGDAYGKLASVINYGKLTDEEKATLTTDFNAAKALREEYESESVYSAVAGYLESNLKYYYQETNSKING